MRRKYGRLAGVLCLCAGMLLAAGRNTSEADRAAELSAGTAVAETSEKDDAGETPEPKEEPEPKETPGAKEEPEPKKTPEPKEAPEENVQEPKKIALTFDDGPHPVYTRQMLDLLEEKNVPATFFLLGQNVEEYGDLVKEIAARGHLIGNHTYHHVQITTLPAEQAYEEIDRTSRLIESLTGKGTEYVRPPFGTWNDGLEAELNLIPVMWTIDTLDWTTGNVDWIVDQVVKNAEENDIILMHDSYKSTVQAVERIVTLLEAEGFEFVTVDEVIMD